MDRALKEARAAASRGETPVGAVIYDPVADKVLASDGNRVRELRDPTGHAEALVIRSACAALNNERLQGLDLYVTLEPCPMCAGIISAARISRLYYGASDPKSGGSDMHISFDFKILPERSLYIRRYPSLSIDVSTQLVE